MDKLYIENLEIFANHGVFKEEKTLGQKFILSFELTLDLLETARTNDLSKGVHYGEFCNKICDEFKKESYDLIETATYNIAEFVLKEYPVVKSVSVLLKKPWAPIHKNLDYAGIKVNRSWHKAYIGLGSNVGDLEKNLLLAIKKIGEQDHTYVVKESKFLKTAPWGYTDQDEFLNSVIEIKTFLTPKELIKFLMEIESELKRERIIKWGPRTIDLDILLYDNLISTEEVAIIPHPRMHERKFVLEPLNEIAPYAYHPILNKRIFQILEDLK